MRKKGVVFEMARMNPSLLKGKSKQEYNEIIELKISQVYGFVSEIFVAYRFYKHDILEFATARHEQLSKEDDTSSLNMLHEGQKSEFSVYSSSPDIRKAYRTIIRAKSEEAAGKDLAATVVRKAWEELEPDIIDTLAHFAAIEIKRIIGNDLGPYGRFCVYANLIKDIFKERKEELFTSALVSKIMDQEIRSEYYKELVEIAEKKHLELIKHD